MIQKRKHKNRRNIVTNSINTFKWSTTTTKKVFKKNKRCGPGKQDFQVGFWNCNTHWPDGKNPLLVVGGVVIIPRSTKYQDRGRLEGVKESMGTLNDMTVVVTVRTVDMVLVVNSFRSPVKKKMTAQLAKHLSKTCYRQSGGLEGRWDGSLKLGHKFGL